MSSIEQSDQKQNLLSQQESQAYLNPQQQSPNDQFRLNNSQYQSLPQTTHKFPRVIHNYENNEFEQKIQEQTIITDLTSEVGTNIPSRTSLLIKNTQIQQFRGNSAFLAKFVIVMIFAGMQMGYILSCMNGLEELFEAKFDIGESTRDLWQSLFGSSGVFGLAVGSMGSGYLMKNGRKRTLIISSSIGIAGVAMQQIPTMATIIIGRVIYGIATGIYSVAVGRYIEETVPHQLLTLYSPIYLCGTSLAKLMVFVINAGLPEDHEREELKQSEFWRYLKSYFICLLGLPMVLFTLVLLGTIFVIKHDTPKFLIINKKHDEAILAISEIYHKDENPQEIFGHLSKNYSKKTDKIAVKEALFGVSYRMATIVMFALVIFHEFSGYASIILYSKKIFKSMQPSALTPKQCNQTCFNIKNNNFSSQLIQKDLNVYMIGIVNFLGTVASVFIIKRFGRRTLLIPGHVMMGLINIIIGLAANYHQDAVIVSFIVTFCAVYQIFNGPIIWMQTMVKIFLNKIHNFSEKIKQFISQKQLSIKLLHLLFLHCGWLIQQQASRHPSCLPILEFKGYFSCLERFRSWQQFFVKLKFWNQTII